MLVFFGIPLFHLSIFVSESEREIDISFISQFHKPTYGALLFPGVYTKRGDERVAGQTTEAGGALHKEIPPDQGSDLLRRTRLCGRQESQAVQTGSAGIANVRVKKENTFTYSRVRSYLSVTVYT